jgi:FTR1 family protein
LIGSLFGGLFQSVVFAKYQEITEGVLMLVSAAFISYIVIHLHDRFSPDRKQAIEKTKKIIADNDLKQLFILVFISVFREGFEVFLFLLSSFVSLRLSEITTAFVLGLLAAFIFYLEFKTFFQNTSYSYGFKLANFLLILFSAGLIAQGIHELAEGGVLSEYYKLTIPFLPLKGSLSAELIKTITGLSRNMDIIQILSYIVYLTIMMKLFFWRKKEIIKSSVNN